MTVACIFSISAAVDRLQWSLSVTVGLLVMVSSELVVLLIVCVGINTGSALQGELSFYSVQVYTVYLDNAVLNASLKCY